MTQQVAKRMKSELRTQILFFMVSVTDTGHYKRVIALQDYPEDIYRDEVESLSSPAREEVNSILVSEDDIPEVFSTLKLGKNKSTSTQYTINKGKITATPPGYEHLKG